MITEIKCCETIIRAKEIKIERAPGVGSVNVIKIADSIWTGDTHLWFSNNSSLSIHIGDITSVETRSSLDEDDEPWVSYFKRDKRPFSYEYEEELTQILENVSLL